MKILVAGANGQVATELRIQGETSSHEVITHGRDQLDIRDADLVKKHINEINPGIVINAAAYTAVDKAEEETALAYAINRDGARHLAESCKAQGIPFIHISTDYVFDGSSTSTYTEKDAVSPLGVYGQSKWAGEEAVRTTLSEHIILRTSWVFSSHGHNFVKTILRVAAERDELKVVDDQLGGPTSAKGIANAILIICDRFEQQGLLPWGTYHYSGLPFTSWHGFAQKIVELGRKHGLIDHDVVIHPIPTEEYPTPAKRPENSRLLSDRITEELGIQVDNWQYQLKNVVTALAKSK
jgi:dTDP-4-dehydrorhamnose reductase